MKEGSCPLLLTTNLPVFSPSCYMLASGVKAINDKVQLVQNRDNHCIQTNDH